MIIKIPWLQTISCIEWMVFYALILHCMAKLGCGQPGLMRWILVWILPQVQDQLLNLQSNMLPLCFDCPHVYITRHLNLNNALFQECIMMLVRTLVKVSVPIMDQRLYHVTYLQQRVVNNDNYLQSHWVKISEFFQHHMQYNKNAFLMFIFLLGKTEWCLRSQFCTMRVYILGRG